MQQAMTCEMAKALHRAGYRMTKPRRAILQVLEQSRESLSPEEIHQRGQRSHPSLGLVTVYRTLEILDELGWVRRVHSVDRCHGYVRARAERHHVVCRRCGRIADFPCSGLDDLLARVERQTGFAIDEHLLELTGLCASCREAE